MEKNGWLQGRIVFGEDLKVFRELNPNIQEDDILIVASQSCDVANFSEPLIELSIGKIMSKVDGNFTHNKNPRKLHISVERNCAIHGPDQIHIELLAHQKISIPKDSLPNNIEPHPDLVFTNHNLSMYVDWLAGRYKRPALPTLFDKRFDEAWKKKRRLKSSEAVSEHLIGIYVKIFPEEELETDPYTVDLLALVTPDLSTEENTKIENLLKEYVDAMQRAGFTINQENPYVIRTEAKVSIATIKQYKRFNLDELSHKNDHPLPSGYHKP